MSGNLCIRQTYVPTYRAELFDLIAERWEQRVIVFAGDPSPNEGVGTAKTLGRAELVPVQNSYYSRGATMLIRQPGICRIIPQYDPSIVVSNSNARIIDTAKLSKLIRSARVPFVGWGLGTTNFFGHPFARLRLTFKRRFFKRFDGVIAYGSHSAQQLHDDLGIPNEKIRIVFNAARRAPRSQEVIVNHEKDFRVLTIGRLVASKRYDLLIKAMQLVGSKIDCVKLVIVGDGPERESLEKMAAEKSIAVEFMGYHSSASLEEIAKSCHLFVLPSLGGLAIQEAMSFALPVVVTEADGTEHDLVRHSNGWILPFGDVNSMADAIIAAAADRTATRQKGIESLRIVSEEINLEKAADAFVAAAKFFINQTI